MTNQPIKLTDPAYGDQLSLGFGEPPTLEEKPSSAAQLAAAFAAFDTPDPEPKSANGLIVGGQIVNIGDALVLVVHVEIGEGQIVQAGLGEEATNNLLIAAGQRNGLVSVTFNPETMEGITFAPRPAKV